MKKILSLLIGLLAVGCVHQNDFTANRVGPDQYTISSHGRDQGPNNYSSLMSSAYGTCLRAGFKDYTITSVASEKDSTILFFQCKKDVQEDKKTVDPKAKESSVVDTLKEMYEDAKKRMESK